MGSFTIAQGKEGRTPKKPLNLITITSPDGDVCYLTTAASNGAASVPYGGQTYQTRILNNDIQAYQAMSPQGYDAVPGFSLTLGDADLALWRNHCMPHGWRGAAVTLRTVLWDVVANVWSSDSMVSNFIGGNPQHSHGNGQTTLDVISAFNFTRLKVPSIPLEYRCPWDFPTTAAQRADGLTNPTSIYYQCGYSPDQPGGVGNYATPGVPFADCDLTRSSPTDKSVGCMARLGNNSDGSPGPPATGKWVAPDGDLDHDLSGNYTGRFGGFTFIMPAQFSGAGWSYITTGVRTFGFNQPNPAIVGTYLTWVYGTQWVNGLVLAPGSDSGNTLRSEVFVCVSAFGPASVLKVVVNGVQVPFNNDVSQQGSKPDKNFTWRYAGGTSVASPTNPGLNVGAGGRSGRLNGDTYYSGQLQAFGRTYTALGDPHGSQCVIEVVLPVSLAAAGSIPTVQVLVTSGPMLTVNASGLFVYAPPSITDGRASGAAANAAFAALDLLTWGNITTAQIDPYSWYTAAQDCASTLSYTAADGTTQTHAQFKASFQLSGTSRQTLAQALTALRNSANLMIGPNATTGLIQCFVRKTLADQQPAPITGSNDTTPRASVTAAGGAATGFFAYYFDSTNIEPGSFKITSTRIEATPNTINFPFQDEENDYQQDSLTEVDKDSYAYSGNQEISVPIPINGVPNFDQATRVANTQLGEALYGNQRDDAGGTLYFEFSCNQRVLHLTNRLGYICGLFFEPEQIGTAAAPQAIRILSLKPDTDGEHWQVKAAWHKDEWYTFAYGQNPTPFRNNPSVSTTPRPPYPFRPGVQVFGPNDALFPNQNSFAVSLDTSNYPPKLSVSGYVPANAQPIGRAAIVPLTATTANAGGTIPAGNWQIQFSSNGTAGPVSSATLAVVPSGTSTNTITVSGIQWPAGAAPAIQPYIGRSSMSMRACDPSSFVGSAPDANGNFTQFTFTAVTTDGLGLPDTMFAKCLVTLSGLEHGGAWGDEVTSVDGTGLVLSFPEVTWTANQWRGRVLSLYYRPGVVTQPGLNITVASSTTNTLAMSAAGFLAGDVVVMRTAADTYSPTSIGDSQFKNWYAPGGLSTAGTGESGNRVQIIQGTGAGYPPKVIASNTATVLTIQGTFEITPDQTSVFIVLEPGITSTYPTSTFSAGGGLVTIASTTALTTREQSLYIQVATADAQGNTAPMQYQPAREIYVPPEPDSVPIFVSSDTTLQPIAQTVSADATGGSFTITLPPFEQWLGDDITIIRTDATTNVVTWATAAGSSDTIPGYGTSGTLTSQGQWITITATQA
jgi:hypothetical protein